MNPIILAAISGQAVVSALIWIIVVAVVFWLLTWLIAYIGVPEPFNKVLKVIIAVAAVLFLINALMTMAGKPLVAW